MAKGALNNNLVWAKFSHYNNQKVKYKTGDHKWKEALLYVLTYQLRW